MLEDSEVVSVQVNGDTPTNEYKVHVASYYNMHTTVLSCIKVINNTVYNNIIIIYSSGKTMIFSN